MVVTYPVRRPLQIHCWVPRPVFIISSPFHLILKFPSLHLSFPLLQQLLVLEVLQPALAKDHWPLAAACEVRRQGVFSLNQEVQDIQTQQDVEAQFREETRQSSGHKEGPSQWDSIVEYAAIQDRTHELVRKIYKCLKRNLNNFLTIGCCD